MVRGSVHCQEDARLDFSNVFDGRNFSLELAKAGFTILSNVLYEKLIVRSVSYSSDEIFRS